MEKKIRWIVFALSGLANLSGCATSKPASHEPIATSNETTSELPIYGPSAPAKERSLSIWAPKADGIGATAILGVLEALSKNGLVPSSLYVSGYGAVVSSVYLKSEGKISKTIWATQNLGSGILSESSGFAKLFNENKNKRLRSQLVKALGLVGGPSEPAGALKVFYIPDHGSSFAELNHKNLDSEEALAQVVEGVEFGLGCSHASDNVEVWKNELQKPNDDAIRILLDIFDPEQDGERSCLERHGIGEKSEESIIVIRIPVPSSGINEEAYRSRAAFQGKRATMTRMEEIKKKVAPPGVQ
jgi:hypothetical protein